MRRMLRATTLEDAIALVNRNPYANGTAIFTESGGAARRFDVAQREHQAESAASARNVATRAGVQFIDLHALQRLQSDTHRTTQVLDVRTPEGGAL